MKLNKKLFGRSLYKIATILFLVGYNFAPAVFAIGDIPKLEVKQDQSVSVTTEETSEVLNEVPVDTSEDIIKDGGVSTSAEEEAKSLEMNDVGGEEMSSRGIGLMAVTDNIRINSVKVNDELETVVAPGGKVSVGVDVSTSWLTSWSSTKYEINGRTICLNKEPRTIHNTIDQRIVPSVPGEYDLKVTAYTSSNCGGHESSPFLLEKAITIRDVSNPILDQTCGLDIALVIDNSSSIDRKELALMKTALKGFVDALSGTPTQFSVTKFGSSATELLSFTSDSIAVKNAIDSVDFVQNNGTNWMDGMKIARETFDPRNNYSNLMVFASDGNPTYPNCGGRNTCDADVLAAVGQANIAKTEQNIRILALGIGDELSKENLKAISGPNVDGNTLRESDVVTTDFEGMAVKLKEFASESCAMKISVNKYINEISDSTRGGSGWKFQLRDSDNNVTANLITDGQGQVSSGELAAGTYTLVEVDPLTGYSYDRASCKKDNGSNVGTSVENGVGGIVILDKTQDIITCDFVNVESPTLKIVKVAKNGVAGSASIGDFGIRLENGPNLDFSLTEESGTTKTYEANPAVKSGVQYTLSENLAGTGYEQESLVCMDGNTNIGSTFRLNPGQNVECTIVNTSTWSRIVVKKLTLPGTDQETEFTFEGDLKGKIKNGESISKVVLPRDGYTTTESPLEGWFLTEATCTSGGTANVETSKAVYNVGANQEITCEFTNSQSGSISGHKYYDEDGKADSTDDRHPVSGWTIFIDKDGNGELDEGEDFRITGADGKYSFANLKPGTYKIVELMKAGWIELTGITQEITIAPGENRENVDFVNIEYPTIQVIKNVDTNGDGTVDQENATDWEWEIGSDEYDTGREPVPVMPGTHTISEVQKDDYHVTSLVCTNGETTIVNEVSESASITLKSGDKVVCTFTNTRDTGTLIVKKVVVNDNGGNLEAKDFSFKIGDVDEVSFTPIEGNTLLGENKFEKVLTGTYSITEVQENQRGYTTTYDNCSNVIVPHNGEATCTITNDDIAPGLTIKKHVKNDNGGTATVGEFGITLTDTELTFDGGVTSGTTTTYTANPTVVSNKEYTVSEGNHPGYAEGGWSCVDDNNPATEISNTFTLSEGQSITCEVTNDDIAPGLTIKKHVKNDNGGTATVGDFGITLTDTELTFDGGVTNGTTTTYTANPTVVSNKQYTVSEGDHPGYAEGGWSCVDDNNPATEISNTFTLSEGQSITCEVTNDDIQPKLTVIKVVDNKEYGDKKVSDFNLYVSGTSVTSGDTNGFNAGDYTVTEDNLDGYTSVITGDCDANGNVTLNVGDNKTCTITNTSTHGKIIIKKLVEPNTNGTEFEFTGDVAGKIGHNGEISKIVLPGSSYSVSETVPTGWSLKALTCDDTDSTRNENTANINVSDNETVTCTFTNKVIDPILEIEKSNDAEVTGKKAGDIVEYTITVTAPKDEAEGTYVLNDVVVSDIAPAGFKYILGTWTAKKNGVDMVIPEPTYNGTDKAEWELGDMVERDEIVLTYTTKISLLTDPGVYPDIAWVKGVSLSGTNVLGNVSTGADTPFVGTDVKVIEADTVEEGEVLGASITLPNTGASTYITLGALIMMILGLVSLLFKPFKKFKYALLASVVVFGMFLTVLPTKVSAVYEVLIAKIEKPVSPTIKKAFNIDFTAQDVYGVEIKVECYKNDVKFATFDKVNAGACPVTVDASGTYKFYVKAISTSGEVKSEDVTVEVIDKPLPVIDYSKAGNVLKFKTANDAKIVKVEIHRSDKPSYTANKDTEIHTMSVSPNTEYSWTDTSAKPGKTYYYALRSLDTFGNVSTMVSDPEVKIAPQPTTTPPRATGTEVAGAETKTEGEVKGDTDKEEPKEVEQVQDGKENPQPEKEGEEKEVELTPSYKKYWYIWVPAILLVLGVGYMYVKRSKEE